MFDEKVDEVVHEGNFRFEGFERNTSSCSVREMGGMLIGMH